MTQVESNGDVRAFDRSVRCEVRVARAEEDRAAQAFGDRGWWHRRVVPGFFEVDVQVVGSRVGAVEQAAEILQDGLRRHGVVGDARNFRLLDVPDPTGRWLPLHRVVPGREDSRLERVLVALGRRDIGASIRVNNVQEAERELLFAHHRRDPALGTLAWRRGFGTPRLPESGRFTYPAGPAVLLFLAPLLIGIMVGATGYALVPVLLGLAAVAALSWGWARMFRAPELAVGPLPIALIGSSFGWRADTVRPLWVLAVSVVLGAAVGLRHLVRDLSLGRQVSWLLPMALPLVIPMTAYVGDLAYWRYLRGLGLSREWVQLGMWDRLLGAAVPVGIATACALVFLGAVGWLRFVHRNVPVAASLVAAAAYLVVGVLYAMYQGDEAAKRPERGFAALRPSWVCVTPLEKNTPTNGALLPNPPRPLLKLELNDSRLALWDPHQPRWRNALTTLPTDKVRAVRVAGEKATC